MVDRSDKLPDVYIGGDRSKSDDKVMPNRSASKPRKTGARIMSDKKRLEGLKKRYNEYRGQSRT